MWVDDGDEAIVGLIDQIPSASSADYGKPFASIFKGYECDFYQVDPMLFSPARIVVHCLRSGTTASSGRLNPDVLRESFA